jgi:hypothetical protein
MPVRVRIKSHYNLDEHAYVFASFVYAFLIVDYFSNNVVKDFIGFMPQIFYPSEWDIKLTWVIIFYFLLFVFFLLFIIESWWGSRLEQKSLGSFWSYIIFLSRPFFLFLTESIVFESDQFKLSTLSEPNLKIILRFFFMQSLILGNLIIVRSYFTFIKEPPQKWHRLNHKRDKLKFLLNFVINNNKDRLKTFFISVLLTVLLYFYKVPQEYQNRVLCLAFVLLIVAVLTLLKHIHENGKKFNKQNYEIFINEIGEQHLPIILRDKKSYGFLLFNAEKVPISIVECILSQIRDDDIYTTDDSRIYSCFLTSDGEIEDFELWIKTWAIEADAEKFWENNDIVFSYKKYKPNNFSQNYNKLEFLNTFKKAYHQLEVQTKNTLNIEKSIL